MLPFISTSMLINLFGLLTANVQSRWHTGTLYLFTSLAFASSSFLCATLSCQKIRQHCNSGQRPRNQGWLLLLGIYVAVNAFTAACGMTGGLLSFLLQPNMPDNILWQGIIPVCL